MVKAWILSRRVELAFLGFLLLFTSIAIKVVSVAHWWEIGWDLSSYSPYAPTISLVGAATYMGLLKLRHTHFHNAPYLWAMGVIWFSFGCLFFYARNVGM